MRLQHRTPGGTLGERSLCWEQIWAGWWWMVDGCKNRTCGLKMDKCGSEQNWPALSAWTKHTGRFLPISVWGHSAYMQIMRFIAWKCRHKAPLAIYIFTQALGRSYGMYWLWCLASWHDASWHPSERPPQSCKALPGCYQRRDLGIKQSQVSEKI